MSHDFSTQVNQAPYSPAPTHFSHQSMADPNMQSRQQQAVAYPSPHSYPSPSMQPTYTYPPPQGQQSNEGYRSSPQGAQMSLPPLNLPPIRLQDGQQSQAQPQQPPQPMGSPLPPPQHGMQQYYPHPGHAQPGQPMMGNMGGPQFNAMRYQLPPQGDQRVLSGGRHKKEIKRRTKTGCLTCRKRRIKVSAYVNETRCRRDAKPEELLPGRLLNRARNPNSSNPTTRVSETTDCAARCSNTVGKCVAASATSTVLSCAANTLGLVSGKFSASRTNIITHLHMR
jgi:hypothetical protein